MTNRTHSPSTMKTLPKTMFVLACVCAVTVLALLPSQAQTFTVIHNFTGGGDGSSPKTGLTVGGANSLYGTAFNGGTSGSGVVFQLKQRNGSWILNPLYSFVGGNDGANPYGRVAIARDGTLYGTTSAGGGQCSGSGCGTVYHLMPSPTAPSSAVAPWRESVLIRFYGLGYSGAYPQGDLVFDASGNIYGTTVGGGNGYGLIYQLRHSDDTWAESVLYFAQNSWYGRYPYGGVLLDDAGNLYGTMSESTYGNAAGNVYRLYQSEHGYIQQTLHTFGGVDGAAPVGGLVSDSLGNLYGTTSAGGNGNGTVFELMPVNGSWTFSTLYTLGSGLPNGGPQEKLTMDAAGNLYGTTYADGLYGYGSIFKLTNSNGQWLYSSLHDFTGGNDGGNPISNIVFDANGNLYGTASTGGSGSACQGGCGVVWEVTP